MAQVMVVTPFRFESSPTITISMKSIIGVSVSGPDFEENPKSVRLQIHHFAMDIDNDQI
jgi:hypothetical protein